MSSHQISLPAPLTEPPEAKRKKEKNYSLCSASARPPGNSPTQYSHPAAAGCCLVDCVARIANATACFVGAPLIVLHPSTPIIIISSILHLAFVATTSSLVVYRIPLSPFHSPHPARFLLRTLSFFTTSHPPISPSSLSNDLTAKSSRTFYILHLSLLLRYLSTSVEGSCSSCDWTRPQLLTHKLVSFTRLLAFSEARYSR